MLQDIEWIINKFKKLAKDKAKKWIGFDEWIEELKNNKEFKNEIENHLSQNQSQSQSQNLINNNNGIETSKYIAVLEENIKLKNELDDYEKNIAKIKITKSEHKVYKEILKFTASKFPGKVISDSDIFGQLRSKGIVQKTEDDRLFEVAIFEKDFEIVED